MATTRKDETPDTKPKCGIVMPISAIEDCSAEHWADVLGILREVIQSAGFDANLVSDADDTGIIQKRIVQNIYNNEIVVCDVSAKNPNVMFELGLRLAFDKPTVIIKDNFTNYSFDTSVIEHLEYPRDLRFTKIIAFKEKLRNKITATYEQSQRDPNYSTFLKSFGEYKVAHLQSKEVSSEAYVLESLEEIKKELTWLRRSSTRFPSGTATRYNAIRRSLRNYVSTINLHNPKEVIEHREILFELMIKDPDVARLYEGRRTEFHHDLDRALDEHFLLSTPSSMGGRRASLNDAEEAEGADKVLS